MQKAGNNNTGARKMLDRLVEEKKKSVTALCLVAIMAFMWVRVFTKKAPHDIEAAQGTNHSITKDASSEEYMISFVELPKVAGRNDVVGRDFFASNGWQHFFDKQKQEPDGFEEVSIDSKNGNEEVIRRVAGKIKLEATIKKMGGSYQALINGQQRETGEKIPISDGATTYECEVLEIRDNVVVIKCEEAEIKLSIKP